MSKFDVGGGSLTDGADDDNVIDGNEIAETNQRTIDGSAILVIDWGQDATRDVIRGNIVSGTSVLGNVGWNGKPHKSFQDPVTRLVSVAIYLDDRASGVAVDGNLICCNISGINYTLGGRTTF